MKSTEMNVVTGAFSYTGKYIAQRLLSMGKTVRTITGHPERKNAFGEQVAAFPFNFDNPRELTRSLEGATTVYNTYWIRFPYGEVTFDTAAENTKTLLKAAEEAGVRRFVHLSIINASLESPLPYFRGKGRVENIIAQSKLSFAILRPTVIFGTGDILINNIAWFLRRFPLFPVAGSGNYKIQPVYVEDLAELVVYAGHQDTNMVLDAVGPETYAFVDLVQLIAEKVRSRARIVRVPPRLGLLLASLIGYMVRDLVLTRDEMEGLMAGLLLSDGPPTSQTRLSHWLEQNRERVGIRYASELRRHYDS